ncbi:2-succinyl-6-hydroxy-2,4-cyclohexadiene-1-carboxylate synthase [Pluralibacter gergoviae]|uniref:2-succinyl-6-hydroxy-2, 4-cyclohexadiene-1-carboxylate synthase n=1 Tax=Pluralibacter gergoviae TaxID=61647 RepID=UPI003EE08681
MSLRAAVRAGDSARPWLVFLHGFSGDCREWQAVGERLTDWPRLYIDLPGHGASAAIPGVDFAAVSARLQDLLVSYNILNYWLIGYSLGGRVAMYFACQQARAGLRGLIVEGSHPGLISDAERRQRREGDLHWARRFAREPLGEVFADWYRQPVFASLTESQRAALAAQKVHNSGVALSEMLMATSLSAQPDLRPALAGRDYPFYYLCGERDEKFRALARALDAPCTLIPLAGHNAHRENPDAVALRLAEILQP